jgi:hypothetical protein
VSCDSRIGKFGKAGRIGNVEENRDLAGILPGVYSCRGALAKVAELAFAANAADAANAAGSAKSVLSGKCIHERSADRPDSY